MATSKGIAPQQAHPALLDRLIGRIQTALVENIGWLDIAYGRAERLTKILPNGRRIKTPNVYAGGNDYREVSPDASLGNFSFFWLDDPQTVSGQPHRPITIRSPFALIVWFDYRRIYEDAGTRNREALKRQILDVLNNDLDLRAGRVSVERIYESAENIYRGFTLDEADNQFLMHPFGGFRFEGMLEIEEGCVL